MNRLLTSRSGWLKIRAALFMCALGLMLIVGCNSGPPYYPVSGTVEFKVDGSKAQFGTVEFRSDTDPPVIARGKIAPDGTYSVSVPGKNGVAEGSYTVVILQVLSDTRARKVVHHHGLEVSNKYRDHRTTDLKVNVDQKSARGLKLLVDTTGE